MAMSTCSCTPFLPIPSSSTFFPSFLSLRCTNTYLFFNASFPLTPEATTPLHISWCLHSLHITILSEGAAFDHLHHCTIVHSPLTDVPFHIHSTYFHHSSSSYHKHLLKDSSISLSVLALMLSSITSLIPEPSVLHFIIYHKKFYHFCYR